ADTTHQKVVVNPQVIAFGTNVRVFTEHFGLHEADGRINDEYHSAEYPAPVNRYQQVFHYFLFVTVD
ncbi:hypothetical protein QP380_06885, partial [Klebsiella aerogenes]|nr:hypothetical protein [Klebsiella aerogenes]